MLRLAVATDYSPQGGDLVLVGPFTSWASAERHADLVQSRLDADPDDYEGVLARVVVMDAPQKADAIERRLVERKRG